MKIYQLNDIISHISKQEEYYFGIFEDTQDPKIEWPHRHNFYSLVWFTHGNGINVIDFEEYEILPNRIFTINPKQIHNWNYSIDIRGYFLLIDEPLAKHLKIDFSSPYVDIRNEDYDFIKEIFKRMSLYDNQVTVIPYLCSILNNSKNIVTQLSDIIIQYKNLIIENFILNSSIDQYSTKLKINSETLNRLCKKELGLSAKQLQLDLKITEAKRLLLYSTLNTTEIGFNLGFQDNSYFSRIFKNKTNLSPADFRKKYPNKTLKS